MNSIVRITIACTALAVSNGVLARGTVPLVDHENMDVVTGSGKPAQVEAVRKAILTAGANSPRRWLMTQVDGGKSIHATTTVRSHTVTIDIVASATKFSIRYVDSVDMKYGTDRAGKPVIHPFYNQWVTELLRSINKELPSL